MLSETGSVLDHHRPKVSRILAEETIPFHMKDYVRSARVQIENRCTGKKRNKVLGYLDFLLELEKTFRGCSFAVETWRRPTPEITVSEEGVTHRLDSRDVSAARNPIVSYTPDEWAEKLVETVLDMIYQAPKIYIYVPTNRFVSGWVSIGDFRKGDHYENLEVSKIGIFSEHIGNPRLARNTYHHALKTTTNPKTALSLAKRLFREENAAKVALRELTEISNCIIDENSSINNLVQAALTNLVEHEYFPSIIEELLQTRSSSGLVHDEMQDYITEVKYQRENKLATNAPILYVRGYVGNNGQQMFDQVRISTTSNAAAATTEVLPPCTEEGLSEEVKRKLSLLMMEEDVTYAPSIGYKYDESIYYVYE